MTVADTFSFSNAPPAAGSRWQRVAASPAALAVTLSALAFGVRSIGRTRAFELWVDEMLYADLGASVSRGELPRLPDGPFFLHPPGFFLLEGGVIKLFGLPTADSMNLVYDLRWLSAALGALTTGLVFLLIRRVAGTWPAVWGALVLVFEPFVLRINSRVFLETVAGLAVVAGAVTPGAPPPAGRGARGWRACSSWCTTSSGAARGGRPCACSAPGCASATRCSPRTSSPSTPSFRSRWPWFGSEPSCSGKRRWSCLAASSPTGSTSSCSGSGAT